ncbi:MAG: cation diffusion facilitator family transporter [Oligoflexia bacterium]|nr:cation diffusion facilitator family transporter [Oligoflexia bacterium]
MGLAATIGLTALKLGVGIASGSVGVLSEAIHSFLDLISAGVTFYTAPHSIKPADEDHPFGHGKFETISSLFEALLLVIAAVMIFYEALNHFHHLQAIEYPGLAMAVIGVSIVISYWVYRQNSVASAQVDSRALRVNALHFLSDVVASVGVFAGLVLLKFTGWLWIDPAIAIVVALYILFVAGTQVKFALDELSDSQLPEAEVREIRKILDGFRDRTIDAHDLRTRKSGSFRHVDFHLVVCGELTVEQSHEICDEIEQAILALYSEALVSIHVEPCRHVRGADCHLTCPIYQKRMKS